MADKVQEEDSDNIQFFDENSSEFLASDTIKAWLVQFMPDYHVMRGT